MHQAVEFAVSNPETTRLILQYAWIIITILTPVVTCLVSIFGCCVSCFRGNSNSGNGSGGGRDGGGTAYNCCPQIQQRGAGEDIEGALQSSGEVNRYEYKVPDASGDDGAPVRRRTVGPVICCCLIVLLVLAAFGFMGMYYFLISIHSVD